MNKVTDDILDQVELLCGLANQSGCDIEIGSGKDRISIKPERAKTDQIVKMFSGMIPIIFGKKKD